MTIFASFNQDDPRVVAAIELLAQRKLSPTFQKKLGRGIGDASLCLQSPLPFRHPVEKREPALGNGK
jgi:hypothetical protein